jgi:single-strand DNA-binding protein
VVNKAIILGRLGGDPETRFTSSGKAVANFSVATDSSYKNNAGERIKQTEWHRMILWGKLAELAKQYLHKGALAYFEGRLQTREWDDKDGQKHKSTEIVVSEMKFVSTDKSKQYAASNADDSGDNYESPTPTPVSEEEIPF